MPQIKETLEVLEAVKKVAVLGTKTFKDGIQISDLGALAELAQNFGLFNEAIKGITEIDDEFKDLDQEEIAQLISKIFDIVSAVKEVA